MIAGKKAKAGPRLVYSDLTPSEREFGKIEFLCGKLRKKERGVSVNASTKPAQLVARSPQRKHQRPR